MALQPPSAGVDDGARLRLNGGALGPSWSALPLSSSASFSSSASLGSLESVESKNATAPQRGAGLVPQLPREPLKPSATPSTPSLLPALASSLPLSHGSAPGESGHGIPKGPPLPSAHGAQAGTPQPGVPLASLSHPSALGSEDLGRLESCSTRPPLPRGTGAGPTPLRASRQGHAEGIGIVELPRPSTQTPAGTAGGDRERASNAVAIILAQETAVEEAAPALVDEVMRVPAMLRNILTAQSMQMLQWGETERRQVLSIRKALRKRGCVVLDQ